MKSTWYSCLSGFLATVVFTAYLPAFVSAQLLPNSTTPSNLTFPSSGFNLNVFTSGPENGGLDLGVPGKNGIFTITGDAPDGSIVMGANGVGVGLDGFASGSGQPQFPLHVVGGGTFGGGDGAFSLARIVVDDRNSSPAFRDMLTLMNSGGGGVRLSLDDLGTGNANFKLDNFNGRFNIWNDTRSVLPIGIAANSNACIEVGANGVGIMADTPTAPLHVFSNGTILPNATIKSEVSSAAGNASRTSLSLENFGGVFMSFKDTSQVPTVGDPSKGLWQIVNGGDEFFIKKAGVNKPGLRFLANGDARFVNNGVTSFAIFANGDVRAIGTYLSNSDRNLKENIQAVNPTDILEKLVKLPVSEWNYIRDEKDTPHMGPMAQDFYAAFGLGNDDKVIAELDKNGVAFAAIQGLNQKVEDYKLTIQEQARLIESQQDQMAELEDRLNRLEALVAPQGK